MARFVQINYCGDDCPYFNLPFGGTLPWCDKIGKTITATVDEVTGVQGFPEDCPLPESDGV